jgi:glutathione reductase (NADPH)
VRVGIAEPGRFGGTCVNVGCIPKKLFSYAAHFREEFEIAKAYGWTAGEPRFHWPTLLKNKDREIARLNAVYEGSWSMRASRSTAPGRTCWTRTR